MTKKTLSPEQKLMKVIYGKPIENMNSEEKKAAYDKATQNHLQGEDDDQA